MAEKKKKEKKTGAYRSAPEPTKAEFAGDITADGVNGSVGKIDSGEMANKISAGAEKYKNALAVVVNAMLVLVSVLITSLAFGVSVAGRGNISYSVFSYFSSSIIVRGYLSGIAGAWTDGAYAVIGIVTLVAVLAPLALAVKNLVWFIVKREAELNMLDCVTPFAIMVVYLGMVNIFGGNMTAGHIISYVTAFVLLALYLVVSAASRGSLISLIKPMTVLGAVTVSLFTLTAAPVWTGSGAYYAVGGAARSGIAAVALVLLASAVLMLALLVAMQTVKVNALLDFGVHAALAAVVTVALVLFAVSAPSSFGTGGAYVFGSVFTAVLAAGYAFIRALPYAKKHNS